MAAAAGGGLIALSAAVGMVVGLSLEGLVKVWWLEEAGAAGVLLGGTAGIATRTREGGVAARIALLALALVVIALGA